MDSVTRPSLQIFRYGLAGPTANRCRTYHRSPLFLIYPFCLITTHRTTHIIINSWVKFSYIVSKMYARLLWTANGRYVFGSAHCFVPTFDRINFDYGCRIRLKSIAWPHLSRFVSGAVCVCGYQVDVNECFVHSIGADFSVAVYQRRTIQSTFHPSKQYIHIYNI